MPSLNNSVSGRIGCAIIGSGNIGTDLMMKILRHGERLQVLAMAGVDSASDGLARARRLGVATTHDGLGGLMNLKVFASIKILFDATSAKAHVAHTKMLAGSHVTWVDLTPAAMGSFCVPVVNLAALRGRATSTW